jgi:LysM repeat protein
MTVKRLIALIVVALLATVLVACELSASTPPPTVSGEGPMGTLQSELGNIASQTAAAAGGVPLVTGVAGETAPPPTEGAADTAVPTAEPTATATQEPPTSEPVEVATATPGIPSSYSLKKGEHPFCIARRFDVNQYELLNINGLGLNSRPQVGFNLKIPQTGNDFAGERTLQSHPDTYSVQSGDSVYSIACKYGDVSPEAIAQRNDIGVNADLEAGRELEIP